MAKNSSLIFLVLFAFLPALALSAVKEKHFTLFQHNIFNETEHLVVDGVPGTQISELGLPFGTMTVYQDNVTVTIDPSSKVVGNAQTVLIASSYKTIESLMVTRYGLELEDGYKGTVSVLGVIDTVNPSDLAISGGTGSFLLVQGYISTSLVYYQDLTLIYQIDFHLYWPSYAPQALIK